MSTTTDSTPTGFTVRYAQEGDRDAIVRLAELDSQPVPRGALLVAEAEDGILAALPLDTGGAIANPFVRTAHLVEVLRFRAAQLASEQNRRRRGLRRRAGRLWRPATANRLAPGA